MTPTSQVASVHPLGDGATVTLSCGHRYYLAASTLPKTGDPQHCWRCERESAERAAA